MAAEVTRIESQAAEQQNHQVARHTATTTTQLRSPAHNEKSRQVIFIQKRRRRRHSDIIDGQMQRFQAIPLMHLGLNTEIYTQNSRNKHKFSLINRGKSFETL